MARQNYTQKGGRLQNLDRRSFLKAAGLGAAVATVKPSTLPTMAGPFEQNEYLSIIPIDKKLDPGWVKSLFERGQKQVYRSTRALEHIGMPIGGLFAGTVYLSGDGRLWLWDIFNRDQEGIAPRTVEYKGSRISTRSGANYLEPAKPFSPFENGFVLRLKSGTSEKELPLCKEGFGDVSFEGRYPQAVVEYQDNSLPVAVRLEAFSPFIPLNVKDSSLPATVKNYTIRNTSSEPIEIEIFGYLANPVCRETQTQTSGTIVNRVVKEGGLMAVVFGAEPTETEKEPARPDILFEDFEKDTYTGWTVEGTAFGCGPVQIKQVPDYQGDLAGKGQRVVNSHASAPGKSVAEKDSHTGKLTSRPFRIQRNYITFLVGGGAHKGKTCVNLLIDGEVVASATGKNNNRMEPAFFDVRRYQGDTARLEIVDDYGNGWGNIGIDQIVFSDHKPRGRKLTEQRDYGSMCLCLIGPGEGCFATACDAAKGFVQQAAAALGKRLVGRIGRKITLGPGESATANFVVSWHFPNFYARDFGGRLMGHWYASMFDSAVGVARYIASNFERLAGQTRTWVKTWYDSTLPYWFLDRTMASASHLATTTCYRFRDGRFWAWEGIGCCGGTCTHVWHYAQALARLFPEVERRQRREIDFGIAMDDQGGIAHRMWVNRRSHPAHDGQCGRILGAYREHLTSPDESFLKQTWPRIKKAIQYLIRLDNNDDGQIEGAQPNTLDAAWYGKVSFLQSLYLAALRAGEAMAKEMDDDEFAERCRKIAERGAKTIEELFNGEYFIQIEDPTHKDKIGVGPGCYIDQVFGQSWAHQVALGRLFDREKQLSALRALWKYNFVPDVGPFREKFTRGRWYAVAGDAGLLMCTWPKGGQNPNFKKHWQYMYFNECMTGFEWQVASHMLAEGMLKEGLAVARAIHDRYDARLRNPYNEIECSDHYARAMAAYGAFISICGFEYHGPKKHIGFAPKLGPEDFRAAFTAAEGWGTFSQKRLADSQEARLELRWGRLALRTFSLELPEGVGASGVRAVAGGRPIPAQCRTDGRKVTVAFQEPVVLDAGQTLSLRIDYRRRTS